MRKRKHDRTVLAGLGQDVLVLGQEQDVLVRGQGALLDGVPSEQCLSFDGRVPAVGSSIVCSWRSFG